MIAYFVRRIAGGLFTAWAATFIFYSLLISPGIPANPQICYDCDDRAERESLHSMVFMYSFDEGWPKNYAQWLFNLSGLTSQTFIFPREQEFRTYTIPKVVTFTRFGLLAGDFGQSAFIRHGIPTLEMYGIEPVAFYTFCFTALFALMLIATLQRRGRPPAIRSTRVPARSRWRPAELWSLG